MSAALRLHQPQAPEPTTPATDRSSANDPAPLLLSVDEVAHLLGIGTSTAWRLHSSGALPQALRVGRSRRWSRDELERWVQAGCPSRAQWERMRKGGGA